VPGLGLQQRREGEKSGDDCLVPEHDDPL